MIDYFVVNCPTILGYLGAFKARAVEGIGTTTPNGLPAVILLDTPGCAVREGPCRPY